MKSVQEEGAKYTERSFKAFLEGQSRCDEKWVEGIIRASTHHDVNKALQSLSYYSGKERFELLKKLCSNA